MPEIGTLVGQVGLPIALVVFYTVATWRREAGMLEDIRELQRFQREEMVRMQTESAAAAARMVAAVERLEALLEKKA